MVLKDSWCDSCVMMLCLTPLGARLWYLFLDDRENTCGSAELTTIKPLERFTYADCILAQHFRQIYMDK